MKVSVCMISYNQAAYIKQALESVFMQKHEFEWEVILGDDASNDGTSEIIKEYADKYDNFHPVFRNENIGAMNNFIDVIGRARGEYICILEGDDYWSDEEKIKKAGSISGF